VAERQAPPPLKHGGAYLITGGAGALGLKVAHRLASTYRARLLLVGRRPADARIEAELAALREAGAAEAHYSAVDLGDAAALGRWAERLPFALSGVIHAAGVESSQPFYEKTPADIAAVLDPKTVGTMALDAALAREPLDFICCFSSSSAVLGDFGSCDYAVANRFQMAYAHHRALRPDAHGRMVVVNWPLWQDGGMGMADPAQAAQYLKRTGLEALATQDGLAVWEELLAAPQQQTLVIVGQPARVQALLERLHDGTPARPPKAAAARLPADRLDQLKRLIKADLLSLQGMEE
jgi:NAD(P)-dependent dehydrogenase (short-subunit alcohol dehydrogenase family)